MSVKKIISLLLLIVLVCSSIAVFAGCDDVPSNYTLEQHKERIAELVVKNYFQEEPEYTNYSIYPLYDINEEVTCFLVEFEPHGFIFVKPRTVSRIPTFNNDMYIMDDIFATYSWQRYRLELNKNENCEQNQWSSIPTLYKYNINRYYEIDELGNSMEFNVSPYKAANVLDKKLYLISLDYYQTMYVPAVKIDEKYINLVSLEEIDGNLAREYNELDIEKNIPYLFVSFDIPNFLC